MRTSYACNQQNYKQIIINKDMWKCKSVRPTTSQKAGYSSGVQLYLVIEIKLLTVAFV